MTNENPYSAPESKPEDHPVVPLAARKIRTVARTFRLLGWLGMIGFGINIAGHLTAVILSLLDSRRTENPFVFLGLAFLTALCLYLPWLLVRTARRLLNQDSRAKQDAMVLSFLMLPAFPFTIPGIYFLLTIRKYYAEYCALPEPVSF